jgi:hypothetical protein
MAEMQNGKEHVCSVKKNNKIYCAGSFDFRAAYIIPEDAWYIVPAKLIRGTGVGLFVHHGQRSKI